MAVAWFRNPVLDESAPIIDRDSVNDRTFGVSTTKRHPAYVYSIHANAGLMHKVRDVEIQWYALIHGGHKMGRLKQPAMIARTVCGMSKPLIPEKTRTCHIPFPDSVLCGRCHGEPATFGKHGKGTKAGLKRLAIEHIVPKVRGGADDVTNLTLACRRCNSRKGRKTAAEFGFPNVHQRAQEIQ